MRNAVVMQRSPVILSRSLEAGLPRVLVAVDRPAIIALVRLTLKHGRCAVHTVTTMAQASIAAAEWQPDVLILDMDWNSSPIINRLRARADAGPPVLVMGLVGPGDLPSKLAAFDAGADDIVTIPFAPEELLARVIALASCGPTRIELTPTIAVGQVELDILNRTVRIGECNVRLTPSEFGLLYLLVASQGRVLTYEEIRETLYGADAHQNVVDRQVRNLRARLQADNRRGRASFIATVGGRGCRFVPSGELD